MQNSRRTFLKSTALMAATAAVLPETLFAQKKIQRLALQLYTVRDEMNKDPKGTLKTLAGLGYTHIEHANYKDRKFYGFTVKEFKEILDDLHMKMPSGHTTMSKNDWNSKTEDFTDTWKQTIDDAAAMGQRYVISPSMWGVENTPEDMGAFMDLFNKCGELCKKAGMKFGYHNHDFEFTTKIGDELLFDFMLKNTDPALVTQQLDIGNMYTVGAQALDYINKYPGRFELMHVKDVMRLNAATDPKPKYENCQLGKGEVPLQKILKAAKKIGGTSLLVIEQEEYQGLGQSESAGLDLKAIKKWGY